MKTFAIFYEAERVTKIGTKAKKLLESVEQLPDGTYRGTRHGAIIYALDPQLLKLHRIGGPAVVALDYKAWYVNGERHRIDGPAYEGENHKEWFVNGQQHRIDGPAFESENQKVWYINGKRHRIDGPAIVEPGYKGWYVDGEQLTEDGYNDLVKRLSTLTDDSDRAATIAAATMFD